MLISHLSHVEILTIDKDTNASFQLLIFAYSIPSAQSSVNITQFYSKFPVILLNKFLLDWNIMISLSPGPKYQSRDQIFFIFVFLAVNRDG